MKRALKWALAVVLVLGMAGFLAFLYFVPPLLQMAPESLSGPVAAAPPPVTGIADPGERAIAERGRYVVTYSGCIGCHATVGEQGPDLSKYLAGGGLKFQTPHGTIVSRNLTPDRETGLGRRTDEEVKRVTRSGVFPDGRVVSYSVMPWGSFAAWTEEDRHAVLVYLRTLPAIRHETPEPTTEPSITEPGAIEQGYGGKDYGLSPAVSIP